MKQVVSAHAPGSLMLMGEHAVLHGRRSLVTAVSPRMRVTLCGRRDSRVRITSSLGDYETDLASLRPVPPFTFLLAALATHVAALKHGLDIRVDSGFSERVGLGSSAAVTVATHAALQRWSNAPLDLERVFDASLRTIRDVQGMGSGADAAASTWGGTVAYRAEPRRIRKLAPICPLAVVYSGSKTPTPEVAARVDALRAKDPALHDRLFDLMDECAARAETAADAGDWATMGRLFDFNQGLLEALGVSNARLAEIVHALREQPGIRGAKISGAGLGDCVIGLGTARLNDLDYQQLEVEASMQGVEVE